MAGLKASVVVPAFNAEKTIGKCLEALERQGFRGYEVIVVDDGSRDNTGEVAKQFPKARVVREENAGPAVARNNGAKNAKGEIVVFTDSDCIAEPNWLEEMLKPFADKRVAGVQGRYKSGRRGLIARIIQLEIEKSYAKMGKQDSIDFIATYSAAYRKIVFEKLGGFDTSFPMASGEDTDFSFRVHESGQKMVFNPNAIVHHAHPTSLWKYLKTKFFRAFWRAKVYKKHRGKMVKDSYTSQSIKLQLLLFYLAIASLALFALGINGLLYSGICLALLFISGLPFALWAARNDLAVGIISPFIIFARTFFFGTGLALGTIKQVFGR